MLKVKNLKLPIHIVQHNSRIPTTPSLFPFKPVKTGIKEKYMGIECFPIVKMLANVTTFCASVFSGNFTETVYLTKFNKYLI